MCGPWKCGGSQSASGRVRIPHASGLPPPWPTGLTVILYRSTDTKQLEAGPFSVLLDARPWPADLPARTASDKDQWGKGREQHAKQHAERDSDLRITGHGTSGSRSPATYTDTAEQTRPRSTSRSLSTQATHAAQSYDTIRQAMINVKATIKNDCYVQSAKACQKLRILRIQDQHNFNTYLCPK